MPQARPALPPPDRRHVRQTSTIQRTAPNPGTHAGALVSKNDRNLQQQSSNGENNDLCTDSLRWCVGNWIDVVGRMFKQQRPGQQRVRRKHGTRGRWGQQCGVGSGRGDGSGREYIGRRKHGDRRGDGGRRDHGGRRSYRDDGDDGTGGSHGVRRNHIGRRSHNQWGCDGGRRDYGGRWINRDGWGDGSGRNHVDWWGDGRKNSDRRSHGDGRDDGSGRNHSDWRNHGKWWLYRRGCWCRLPSARHAYSDE